MPKQEVHASHIHDERTNDGCGRQRCDETPGWAVLRETMPDRRIPVHVHGAAQVRYRVAALAA